MSSCPPSQEMHVDQTNQNIGCYHFAANGQSSNTNALGMREMQAQAFEKRNAQYLLIKAPPACGKSRALMFIALDKLAHQGLTKVIVAVPQKAIASSFKSTKLPGFGMDWEVQPNYELCSNNYSESSNIAVVNQFLQDPKAQILVCAHPTLIRFYNSLEDKSVLNQALIAIDEFHHVSAEETNQLGNVVHSLMQHNKAHIVAMTGSYFRGDRIPVLDTKDEQLFEQVIYTYYQQLNGYKYLKQLKLDYSFYDDTWLSGLDLIINPQHKEHDYRNIDPKAYLDPNAPCFEPNSGKPHIALKTIIYIPSVNSIASTKDKRNEFMQICEILGTHQGTKLKPDPKTGFYKLRTHYGTTITVADLILEEDQERTITSLRNIQSRDDVDIILALGMAKEGFDWPWCEHVIVAGFRQSLTEVVQIIGRATRDCEGKTIAKFTNLIKYPDALRENVEESVDDLIKAISLSLMMEQVLAPNIKFVPRSTSVTPIKAAKQPPVDIGVKKIVIDDEHFSPKLKKFVEEPNAIQDLAVQVINNLSSLAPAVFLPNNLSSEQSYNFLKSQLASFIQDKLPVEEVSDYPDTPWKLEDYSNLADLVIAHIQLTRGFNPNTSQPSSPPDTIESELDDGGEVDFKHSSSQEQLNITNAGNALLKMHEHLINVNELDFSLIERCNPFGEGFEILSRNLTAKVLKKIQEYAILHQAKVTLAEARLMWKEVEKFCLRYNRAPDARSNNMFERRLGEIVLFLRELQKKQKKQNL